VLFLRGLLNVGEVRAVPVVKAVRAAATEADLIIIDAPPGTSCPVIEAVRNVDFVLLVTEPTPFGFHDLKLAVDMVRALGLPLGVLVNRADKRGVDIRSYCSTRRIPVIGEIPDERELAEAYSRGEIACKSLAGYDALFADILDRLAQVWESEAPPPRIGRRFQAVGTLPWIT